MTNYITGANGFIGQHLMKRLDGVAVPRREMPKHTGGPFKIYHLGAYGNHYTQRDTFATISTNITWTNDLMLWANERRDELVSFYNFSTAAIHLPVQTMYSQSKKLTEMMADSYGFTNIRPYSVFGPGEAEHRLIPTIIRHLVLGDEMKLSPFVQHDWIYIDDFIDAILNGETEIGTGQYHTNLDVYNFLNDIHDGLNRHVEFIGPRAYDVEAKGMVEHGVPHRPLLTRLIQTYEHYKRAYFGNQPQA